MTEDPAVWADAKKGIGSFGQGSIQSFLDSAFGIGTENQRQLRNALNSLKSNSSFDQGGKNLTKTELGLIKSFLADMDINPDVAIQRLRSRKKEYVRSLAVFGIDPSSNDAPPKPGGNTSYEAYLARQKANTNGR